MLTKYGILSYLFQKYNYVYIKSLLRRYHLKALNRSLYRHVSLTFLPVHVALSAFRLYPPKQEHKYDPIVLVQFCSQLLVVAHSSMSDGKLNDT